MTVFKIVIAVLCGIWILAAGWHQILRPQSIEDSRLELREQLYLERMRNCRGTFKERYDCKSAASLERNENVASRWAKKLLVIFVAPLLLAGLYTAVFVFVERRKEKARVRRRQKRIFDEK